MIWRVAVKRFAFGKHIYIFTQLGAMDAATGFLHTLYFFQIFFNLATGVTKLTMYVARLTLTHQTRMSELADSSSILDWLSIVEYFQSQS